MNINEASYGRIYQHTRDNGTFAIIGSEDKDTGESRYEELKQLIKKYEKKYGHLGYNRLSGTYQYKLTGKVTNEKSVIIYDISKKDALSIAKQINQESIIWKESTFFGIIDVEKETVLDRFRKSTLNFTKAIKQGIGSKLQSDQSRTFGYAFEGREIMKRTNLSESIITKLNETIGYAEEETINALTDYYTTQTGSPVSDIRKTGNTGGGLSHHRLTKVTFGDGTVMAFIKKSSDIDLEIYNTKRDNVKYCIDIWDSTYKEDLDAFIAGKQPEGSHKFPLSSDDYVNEMFRLQDAIDQKGDIVVELENSGNNKQDMLKLFDSLPDDFPAILVEGLWNTMHDGKLMTVKQLKEWLNKYNVTMYGGRDKFVIYDNLVYLHIKD